MPVINLLNLWMAFESLLWVGAATRQKNIFRIHNCTCIATGYRMSPINNSTTICTSFTCFARQAFFYCSYESHHPSSSDESSRNCIMMFGFKLSKLLHYLYVYVRNTTSFKLETSHPSSQRTLFNLAQTPGNLATVWGGPYVNVFAVRNHHLESSILLL